MCTFVHMAPLFSRACQWAFAQSKTIFRCLSVLFKSAFSMPLRLIALTMLLFDVKFKEALLCGTEAEVNSAFAAPNSRLANTACAPAHLGKVGTAATWPVVHFVKPCEIHWHSRHAICGQALERPCLVFPSWVAQPCCWQSSYAQCLTKIYDVCRFLFGESLSIRILYVFHRSNAVIPASCSYPQLWPKELN